MAVTQTSEQHGAGQKASDPRGSWVAWRARGAKLVWNVWFGACVNVGDVGRLLAARFRLHCP